MRSNRVVLLGSVLLLVSAGLAQDGQTPTETLQDRVSKANRAMMSMAYRQIRTVEGSVDGAPPKVAVEDTYTRAPGTGVQSIKRTHTPEGIITSEIIQLYSGKTYKKTGDGQWEVDSRSLNGRPVPKEKPVSTTPGVNSAPKPSVETKVPSGNQSFGSTPDKPRDNSSGNEPGTYADKTAPSGSPRRIKDGTCEPERLNGRPALRCELSRISEADRAWIETYWFNENGLILKSVTKMSSRTTAGSTMVGITTISYEYDPNIKVEAPINP